MKLRSGTDTGTLAEQRKKLLSPRITKFVIRLNDYFMRMYKPEVRSLSDHEYLMKALHMSFSDYYTASYVPYEKAKEIHEVKIISEALDSFLSKNRKMTKERISQLVQRLIYHDLKMLFE